MLLGVFSGLFLVLNVPALRGLFCFSLLHLDDLLIVFATGTLSIDGLDYSRAK